MTTQRECCEKCRYQAGPPEDPNPYMHICPCHSQKPAQVKLEHFVGSLANRPWANFEKPAQEKLPEQSMEERFDKTFEAENGYPRDVMTVFDVKAFITAEVQKAEERGFTEGQLKYNQDGLFDAGATKERQRIVALVEGMKGTMNGDAADCILVEVIRSIQEPTDV